MMATVESQAQTAIAADPNEITSEVERVLGCIAAAADHYQILGITREASAEDIRRAYCNAVERLHPLKRRDAVRSDGPMQWKLSQVFLRVVEAFSTLSRPGRRIEYDAMLNPRPMRPLPLPRLQERGHDEKVDITEIEEKLAAVSKSNLGTAFGRANHRAAQVSDRRKTVRLALRIPVRITSETRDWQEVTESEDLSQFGIRFCLKRTLQLGTMVYIELPMPHSLRSDGQNERIYAVKAAVRHIRSADPGVTEIGAEFVF